MKRILFFLVLFLVLSTNVNAAQIVCIDIASARDGISDVWDIISIHDDNVQLTGPGYEDLKILKVDGLTKAEVEAILFLNMPPMEIKEGKEYWLNPEDDKYYEIKISPKYQFTLEDLTQSDIVILNSTLSTTSAKSASLQKVKHKVQLYPQNFETVNTSIKIK